MDVNSEAEPGSGVPDLVSDCRLMLRYARKNAIDVPADLQREIAQLDSILIRLNFTPLSDIQSELVAARIALSPDQTAVRISPASTEATPLASEASAATGASSRSESDVGPTPAQAAAEASPASRQTASALEPIAPASASSEPEAGALPIEGPTRAQVQQPRSTSELVLKVHEELSKIIAPATALSLQTTEPPPGRHRFLGGMPLVVKWAAVLALVSAMIFVTSALFLGHLQRMKSDVRSTKNSDATSSAAGRMEGTKP